MANNFCRYLSNGYTFDILTHPNKVFVKPCCWFNAQVELDSNIKKNRLEISQINDWTQNCSQCKKIEQFGQQSLRQTGPDWIDDADHYNPVCIDIMLENNCNAACIICSEYSSSLWGKEKQKVANRKFNIADLSNDVDGKIDQIFKNFNFDKVKYIKFFGGEPFFTNTHLKILQRLPFPENITVHYTTNGSILPNEQVLDVWKKFHTIIFAVSIDGIGEQFNYVRWPLKWDKVQQNLFKLRDTKIQNLLFRVEFTASFLNIWYFDTVEKWVIDNFNSNFFGDKTELNIHLYTGEIFNVDFLSQALKDAILEKYSPDTKIYNLVKTTTPLSRFTPFFNFAKTWDNRRKLHWQDCFTDIKQYLNEI